MGLKMQKNISTSFESNMYLSNYVSILQVQKRIGVRQLTWNVSENFDAEILNNLNMLTKHFIATKFKELLAETVCEGLFI